MGIPVYFKTILNNSSNDLLCKEIEEVDGLYFDLNCLIHPCCRKLNDENEMIKIIIETMDSIIDMIDIKEYIYIAIDGIAPAAKMKQQRYRRFKSLYEKKDDKWDTNSITPGTFFMDKLNEQLKNFKNTNLRIYFSDSSERGEGEHKIFNDLKKRHNKKVVIYGLDADLIMLSLLNYNHTIYLLRERTEYNIENIDSEYIFLPINGLGKDIHKNITDRTGIDTLNYEDIISDYIFICFLLGNDFINHIPNINLRYGGHEKLIEIYCNLLKSYGGYFQLINLSLKNIINLDMFRDFVRELSNQEDYMKNKCIMIQKKIKKRLLNEYIHIKQDFIKRVENYSLKSIYSFNDDNKYLPEEIDNFIVNLPMIIETGPNETISSFNLSEDFIKSLLWTTHYYFNRCIDWRYMTKYDIGPSISDLKMYLDNIKNIDYFSSNLNEYSYEEQFKFIFPNNSHILHSYDIITKEYDIYPIMDHCRYLWEAPLLFK